MLLMAIMLAPVADGDRHPWATFSRGSPMNGTTETVEIETLGSDPATRRPQFVMTLTWRRLGKVTVVQRADSSACRAVTETVHTMRGLSVPRLAPPDGGDSGTIVSDGTSYTLDAPATGSNGRISLASNIGTPLAAWVDARLAALAPCWKPAKS